MIYCHKMLKCVFIVMAALVITGYACADQVDANNGNVKVFNLGEQPTLQFNMSNWGFATVEGAVQNLYTGTNMAAAVQSIDSNGRTFYAADRYTSNRPVGGGQMLLSYDRTLGDVVSSSSSFGANRSSTQAIRQNMDLHIWNVRSTSTFDNFFTMPVNPGYDGIESARGIFMMAQFNNGVTRTDDVIQDQINRRNLTSYVPGYTPQQYRNDLAAAAALEGVSVETAINTFAWVYVPPVQTSTTYQQTGGTVTFINQAVQPEIFNSQTGAWEANPAFGDDPLQQRLFNLTKNQRGDGGVFGYANTLQNTGSTATENSPNVTPVLAGGLLPDPQDPPPPVQVSAFTTELRNLTRAVGDSIGAANPRDFLPDSVIEQIEERIDNQNALAAGLGSTDLLDEILAVNDYVMAAVGVIDGIGSAYRTLTQTITRTFTVVIDDTHEPPRTVTETTTTTTEPGQTVPSGPDGVNGPVTNVLLCTNGFVKMFCPPGSSSQETDTTLDPDWIPDPDSINTVNFTPEGVTVGWDPVMAPELPAGAMQVIILGLGTGFGFIRRKFSV